MDGYFDKIKAFKREDREDHAGEYTFLVKVGVVDNEVEVKETVTMCKVVRVVVKSHISDATYNPESDKEAET